MTSLTLVRHIKARPSIVFDAVTTAAQESKDPQRDMPVGILGSLAICTVLYIAVAIVLTGIVHYSKLNVADPLAVKRAATSYAVGNQLT